jgi:hypothetical protein
MEKGYYLPFFMNLLQCNSFITLLLFKNSLIKFGCKIHLNIQFKEAKSKLKDIKKYIIRSFINFGKKDIKTNVIPPS